VATEIVFSGGERLSVEANQHGSDIVKALSRTPASEPHFMGEFLHVALADTSIRVWVNPRAVAYVAET
jgi:hypothetical protein